MNKFSKTDNYINFNKYIIACKKIILHYRKCILKYLGVISHGVCVLLLSSSGKQYKYMAEF